MLIKSTPSWVVKENRATPEGIYLNRRSLMKGTLGALAVGSAGLIGGKAFAQEGRAAMDAVRNETYVLDRDMTPEDVNLKYNNFYEFGSHKRISANAEENLVSRPWQVEIGGMVNNPMTLDVDELIAKVGGLEERLYRLRCVEAWSMTVPWIGFSFARLANLVEPLGSAKYLKMETFNDPDMANGISNQPWYPWPYVESITMDEVANELAFLVVGAYGKQVPNSMGAPIRMHLPWKYGFKSIKSIVKFTFVEERPIGFWEEISSAREYGFWANVNPQVPHPRWSQETERVLHTDEMVPTLLYNGYAEQVGDMYAGLEGEDLFR